MTIAATFSSTVAATPGLACGNTAGSYPMVALDNGVGTGSLHQQIVTGLMPGTTYFCQVTATNEGGSVKVAFTATTTATPVSTAITGLSLGAPVAYNSLNPNNRATGDTFYNCKSNDGVLYMTSDDGPGFTISGSPAYAHRGGAMNLNRVSSESPLTIQTFQRFPSYAPGTYFPPDYLSDGLSSKNSGIFCMGGDLYLAIGRQNQDQGKVAPPPGGAMTQMYGNVIRSSDHGKTWNNPQQPENFQQGGLLTSTLNWSMFGSSPTNMASAEFVHYCADDGTLGYSLPCNKHDNGDAYVYLVANEGAWNGGGAAGGGDAFYLARVARARLKNLNGAEYQWFTGGDGTADDSWSSNQASAAPILSNFGQLGEPNIQYVPALNRYLMLTFYYPDGVVGRTGNKLNSVWLGYEAPHPWGPWRQIYRQQFTGPHGGAYNPVILNDTIYTGTTPTVVWTGNFFVPDDYTMFLGTLTIEH